MEKYPSQHTRRILVIEDDDDMRELIASVLEGDGYRAIVAPDGEDGLKVAEAAHPDLILLDVMLPKISGVDVCRKLSQNQRTSDIPVIMLTVKKDLSIKLSSYIAGARRYLTKPFDASDLLGEIHQTLRQRDLSQTAGSISNI